MIVNFSFSNRFAYSCQMTFQLQINCLREDPSKVSTISYRHIFKRNILSIRNVLKLVLFIFHVSFRLSIGYRRRISGDFIREKMFQLSKQKILCPEEKPSLKIPMLAFVAKRNHYIAINLKSSK